MRMGNEIYMIQNKLTAVFGSFSIPFTVWSVVQKSRETDQQNSEETL